MTAPHDHQTPLEHRVAVAGALLRTGMRRLGFYGAALGLLGGFVVLTGVGSLGPSVAQANPAAANVTVTVTTTKRVTTVVSTVTTVTTLPTRATTLTTVTSPLSSTVSLTSTSFTTTNFGVTIRVINGTTTTGT